MPALIRHRFTVSDFHRLVPCGVLGEDSRTELIDGEVFDQAPITPRLAGIVNHLNHLLAIAVHGRAIVGVRNPVVLDGYSELYPEILLLKPRPDFYRHALPRSEDVLLLIEVADHEADFDRSIKLPLYVRHGITEVWLVDAAQQCVEICRQPEASTCAARRVQRSGCVQVLALPDIAVDVPALF